MPTIHITIDDHTETLGVVAYLLNAGHEVSIDLDFIADGDEGIVEAARNVDPFRYNYDHAAKMEHQRQLREVERLTARDYDEQRMLRAIEREARQKMYEEEDRRSRGMTRKQYEQFKLDRAEHKARQRHLVGEIVHAVACTYCDQPVGSYCRADGGTVYTDFAHVDRRRAYNEANEAVPAIVEF